MIAQIKDIADCTRVTGLAEVKTMCPNSSLSKHLADVAFDRDEKTGRIVAMPKARRSGSSGKPGNYSRKQQVRRGVLRRPSAYYKQLHRGLDPVETRRKESAKRSR